MVFGIVPYRPFRLDSLNKGRLLDAINADMDELQRSMLEYVRRHGPAAEKAKAVLTIKISLCCVEPIVPRFDVRVEPAITIPKSPPSVSTAEFEMDDKTGKPQLMVQDFPRQAEPGPRLPFEESDETVDQETGEVTQKGRAAPAAK